MSNTEVYRIKKTKSVTTWAKVTRLPALEQVEQLSTESKIFMNSDTRSKIEDCLLNGKIQPNAKISFPLNLNQRTRLLSKISKKIILADTSSGEDFEVKLLRLYTRDEWSALMAVGNMDPVSIPGVQKVMDYGCQIAIIRKL